MEVTASIAARESVEGVLSAPSQMCCCLCAAACVLLVVCGWLCAGCCKCGVCVRYQRGSRSLTMNLQAATGESEQPVAAEAVDEDEDEEEEELEFGDEVIIQLRKSQSAAAAVYRL